ncbi:hypothetical protein JNUCC64_22710 [Streptomyces sp. JNUCC 64]
MAGRELKPSDHSKKDVRRILEKWVGRGWTLQRGGHWGKLSCPCGAGCTVIPVAGSPRSEGHHARKIDRLASRCPSPPPEPPRRGPARQRRDRSR